MIIGHPQQGRGEPCLLRHHHRHCTSFWCKVSNLCNWLSQREKNWNGDMYLGERPETTMCFEKATNALRDWSRSGVFTVPVSGIYLLSLHLCSQDRKKVKNNLFLHSIYGFSIFMGNLSNIWQKLKGACFSFQNEIDRKMGNFLITLFLLFHSVFLYVHNHKLV